MQGETGALPCARERHLASGGAREESEEGGHVAKSEQVGRSRCGMLRHACDNSSGLKLVSLREKLHRAMCENRCEKFLVDIFEFIPGVAS